MGLREEIVNYIDGEGLVAPNLVGPGTVRGSDNGPLFTSSYYVMLAKRGELTDIDKLDFNSRISDCIDENGLLNRHHVGPDNGQEGPDDYYGVLDGSKAMGNTAIPRSFLRAVVKYLGFLNNADPGKKTGSSFLVRQPQLLAAMIAAAFPSWKNPAHVLIRLLAFPLFFVAAIVIAISCIGTDKSEADPRRLSWHLIQTVRPVSLMCWISSKVWYRRLYRDYGPDGMKAVAREYYRDSHPFQRYWVD